MKTIAILSGIAFVLWLGNLLRQARRLMRPCQRCRRMQYLDELSTVDRRLLCGSCVAQEITEAFGDDMPVIVNRRDGQWSYRTRA